VKGSAVSVFSSAGDCGDVLYSLPAIKALGGGALRLVPAAYTTTRMTPALAESLAPLLRHQPYITDCRFAEYAEGTDLDTWRRHYRSDLNVADLVCLALGLSAHPQHEPWLTVPRPRRVARVLFHRSHRYHNGAFPWHRVYQKYGQEAAVVGTADEHRDFCAYFGALPHIPTPTFLDLAEVIAGCQLFIGNQSAPMAVALGLGKPLVQEVCLMIPNCFYERANAVYGYGADVVLPDLR
jgi:hypothetical protein